MVVVATHAHAALGCSACHMVALLIASAPQGACRVAQAVTSGGDQSESKGACDVRRLEQQKPAQTAQTKCTLRQSIEASLMFTGACGQTKPHKDKRVCVMKAVMLSQDGASVKVHPVLPAETVCDTLLQLEKVNR